MKKAFFFTLIYISLSVPIYRYSIVRTYPHSTSDYTQGLEFDSDGSLFQSTGQYAYSKIQHFLFPSMEKIREVSLPSSDFGEGLTVLNDKIYQLTWREKKVYVYNKKLEKITALNLPGKISEGWGICHDRTYLYVSNGSNRIFKLDPQDFKVVSYVDVQNNGDSIWSLNELEWIDGEIWANIYFSKYIARIDPATGKVLGWVDLTGLESNERVSWSTGKVLNGIAYYEGRIVVTGKDWKALYEIELTLDKDEVKTPKLK